MTTIYCVEDDQNIRELVVYALKSSDYEARGFEKAPEFYAAVEIERPALVVLDIMLPGEDGLSVLSKLRSRKETAQIPVIMLTAKSAEYDRVLGLDSGADDYISKPFGVMELLARVKALLRRSAGQLEEAPLRVGAVVLDRARHQVWAQDELVALTFKEFALLEYLMEHPGRVLSREKIIATVWGFDYEGESRTVDMHIKTLRQKLGEVGAQIVTVRGVGYRMGE
ncbi:MAG: response regulator transcription factor [Syntrophomonadaceae bacterium]|nr:response regulator transcription factor [Syntrophomonadaceae bacterium]